MEKIEILANKTRNITVLSVFIIFIVLFIVTIVLIINKYNKNIKQTSEQTVIMSEANNEIFDLETEPVNEQNENNEMNQQDDSNILNVDLNSEEQDDNVELNSEEQDDNVELKKWNLILVNKDNYLPDDFEVKLKTLANGHQVDERIYLYLQDMLDDAKECGLKPVICSTYRSIKNQIKLYDNKVKEYRKEGYSDEKAKNEASMWVAIPGTSEHHTGLAVDIVCSAYQSLDEKQEDTEVQKWLLENSYKYGFILRYPTNKSDITGINYEPWHYRYVGIEHAIKIKEQNVTLEEYLEQRVLDKYSFYSKIKVCEI